MERQRETAIETKNTKNSREMEIKREMKRDKNKEAD